jgi:hypothetical protein
MVPLNDMIILYIDMIATISPEIIVNPGFEITPAIIIRMPKIIIAKAIINDMFVKVRVDKTLK